MYLKTDSLKFKCKKKEKNWIPVDDLWMIIK